MNSRPLLALLCSALVSTTTAAQTSAFELTPAPTPELYEAPDTRTPIDALPYKITKPGSYVVTCDVHVETNESAILVGASDVTIDLDGHTLTGNGSSSGIASEAALENVTVRNGVLRNWGAMGVDLETTTGVVLEGVHVSGSSVRGVETGSFSMIRECTLTDNASGARGYGITLVADVHASGNDMHGMQLLGASLVVASTFDDNNFASLSTVSALIDGCTVRSSNSGVTASGGSVVNDCLFADNNNWGLYQTSASVTTNCTASGNELGLFTSSPFQAHVFLDNTSTGNIEAGIRTGWNCLIRGNISAENGEEGIRGYESSLIVDNVIHDNGGDGIRVDSTSNRIDGNNVTANGRGVVAVDDGNVVVRNKSTLNIGPDFDVPTGTWFGPIASSITSATPWSNFSF